MEDSNPTRFWTLPKAQDAIRSTFFARELELEGKGPVELRFSDFKTRLAEGRPPIGDRTLSRALDGLVTSGHLKKRREGRSSFYAFEIPRGERVAAMAKADAASVERAGNVGGLGDLARGIAVYGVPEALRSRLRRQLRRELTRHQEALIRMFDRTFEGVVLAAVAPAKRRLTRREFNAGVDALCYILENQGGVIMAATYGTRIWQTIDRTQPGALSLTLKRFDLPGILAMAISTLKNPSEEGFRALARRAGEPEEDVKREVLRVKRKLDRWAAAVKPLWGAMTEAQRKRANAQLGALIGLWGSLTSVVHL